MDSVTTANDPSPPPPTDGTDQTDETGPVPAEPTVTPPTAASTDTTPAGTGTRGRPPSKLLGIRHGISTGWAVAFGAMGIGAVFLLWIVAAARLGDAGAVLIPSPARTMSALGKLWTDGTLLTDLIASSRRIAIGYAISVLIGVIVGLAIGTFPAIQAGLEPQFAFLRYIPATALTPVFLLWLGIGESPKIWLIVVGTVFFNILMVADVVRAVPRELINASYTLGAGRARILRKVLLPHSVPGIIDVARINLAAAWLMLVVAEILAAQEGLAFRILRAQRSRGVDQMFALLIVFGLIGVASDLFLRWLRDRVAPWNRP